MDQPMIQGCTPMMEGGPYIHKEEDGNGNKKKENSEYKNLWNSNDDINKDYTNVRLLHRYGEY